MRVAEVIINRPAKKMNSPFSYAVPEHLGTIMPGTRVAVPLGRTREEGILIGYRELEEVPSYQIKPIQAVLDKEPWFTPEMLATAKRLSEYYLCALSEALSLFTIDKKQLKSYERPKEQWLLLNLGLSRNIFRRSENVKGNLVFIYRNWVPHQFIVCKKTDLLYPL